MEKYIKPEINVVKLDIETNILAGSLDADPSGEHPDQRAPKYESYADWEFDEE